MVSIVTAFRCGVSLTAAAYRALRSRSRSYREQGRARTPARQSCVTAT